jgi:mannose-6-phosphate isomerase-like protein (cupin superfamily)
MMNDADKDRNGENVIEMRWLLQREFGSNLVFFHEVLIPPGKVEGTHQHIGSEELYYIIEGNGIAYMGENDDPATRDFPTVERSIFGFDQPKRCKELPVRPGSIIFTKSGGIHGIRNPGSAPLRFVAFLYHGS